MLATLNTMHLSGIVGPQARVFDADNDVVARGMKFFVYKRGGHRVIINKMGDLIVRPNPMEASLRLLPCAGSVQQHLLTSYLQSFVAIMVAQFKPTSGPKTDMLAVLDLLRHNAVLTVSSLAT